MNGDLTTDKLFTGQRQDGTGLYYYNARYYDPSIGRFTSPDTIIQDLWDPQTLNPYTYCRNNPLKYTDPTGHWSIKKAAKAAAKAVVKNINYVQMAIDIAGLIPVVGEAFDAANAAIYAARGDYVSAGLSLAACIPVAGTAATAGKLAKTAVRVVDNAQSLKMVTKAVVKASDGFTSFGALKKALPDPGKGKVYHHIVEQCQIQKSGFDPRLIHNPNNAIAVDSATNAKIAGYYKGKDSYLSTTMSIRDALAGRSIEFQYQYGLEVLKKFGV